MGFVVVLGVYVDGWDEVDGAVTFGRDGEGDQRGCLVMTCDKVLVVAVLGSLATAAGWLEQGLLVLGEMVEEMTMLVTGSVATRSMGRCRCSLTMYRIEREKVSFFYMWVV